MHKSLRSNFEKLENYQALKRVLVTLRQAGFESLIAGGAVRDALLNRALNDIDIATSAAPDQVVALFEKTIEVGKSFGVIVVQMEGYSFEVASFRREGEYTDGRKPDQVQFDMCTAEEDAARRDFTVNALFYDLLKDEIKDYVGGIEDLKKRELKAVGNPEARFQEDHLRILRALRFTAQLGFAMEIATLRAVKENLNLALTPSRERISVELTKIMISENPLAVLQFLKEGSYFQQLGLQFDSTKESLWADLKYWQRSEGQGRAAWFLMTFLLDTARESVLGLKEKFKLTNKSHTDALLLLRLRELSQKPHQQTAEELHLGEFLEVILAKDEELGRFAYYLLRDFEPTPWTEKLKPFVNEKQSLPLAKLRASHLQGKLFGAKMGEALRKAYWIQIHAQIFEAKDLATEDLLQKVL